MSPYKTAVILIGMPGVGKSTLGRLLSQRLAMPFVDTDQLIEDAAGCSLQAIVDQGGFDALVRWEESAILTQDFTAQVVATGGSVVYSDRAMEHLGGFGPRLWLRLGLDELGQRLDNFAQRGIARRQQDADIQELFDERCPLYQQYSDRVVDLDGLDEAAAQERILAILQQ